MKQDGLAQLRGEMTALVEGVYGGEKKVLVFGEGAPGARAMLIGEAPGEREALAGRPFVGKAGKNLDELLAVSGLAREELYVTNAVKFRPTKLSQAGRRVNRAPTQEEISLFLPFLRREIALVTPGVVVTLGNVPLRALLGARAVIGEMHGREIREGGLRIFAMYHPASIIYNRALRDVYERDMSALSVLIKNL